MKSMPAKGVRMTVQTKRLRAIPAALAVAATVPLLAPIAADAAMGGANALTTALRPDLRSATVQSSNEVDDTTTVRVCFSKAIASLPQAAHFQMGNYRDDDPGDGLTAVSATRTSSNCADAVFPNVDAKQYTFVTVEGSQGTAPDSGISAVSSNGFGNIQDSTALIGSQTSNGTRGFGAGPDLVGVAVNNAAATIDYTFDQRVSAVSPLGADFAYNLPTGIPVSSLAGAANRSISSDGLTVRVKFPAGPTIQGAVRAYARAGSVAAKAGGAGSHLRSSARPGNGGFTDRPDLVAVTGAADGSYVDFQYDQVLTAVPGGAAAFDVGSSDAGTRSPVAVPTIVGGPGVGNTVRALITSGTTQHEYYVQASSSHGAVMGAGGLSTAGGLPMGGNSGAFATGFTVGTEALTVSFDNATDVAHVLFDQRWTTDDKTRFKLIDDQGSQIAAGAINVSGAGSPTAGKITADVTFPAGTLTGARSLLIQTGATNVAIGPYTNRVQVISPTAAAAAHKAKFRKAKTITRTQRAAIRRSLKRGH
jgi:hypothetical protein